MIIEVEGLRKRYRARHGPVEAVAGIDFAVAAGEFVGYAGPNGAGKSTTIKMRAPRRLSFRAATKLTQGVALGMRQGTGNSLARSGCGRLLMRLMRAGVLMFTGLPGDGSIGGGSA